MGNSSFPLEVGDIGAAGAAALRKVSTLAEQAPKGRFFASIATLNELSAQTLEALEKGDMQRASHVAAQLAQKGEFRIPSFFKKKA
jgi:hypothetical protein